MHLGNYYIFSTNLEGLVVRFYYLDDCFFEDEIKYRHLSLKFGIGKIEYKRGENVRWKSNIAVNKLDLCLFLKEHLLENHIIQYCSSEVSFTDLRIFPQCDPLNAFQVMLETPICGQGKAADLSGPELRTRAVLGNIPSHLYFEFPQFQGHISIQIIFPQKFLKLRCCQT